MQIIDKESIQKAAKRVLEARAKEASGQTVPSIESVDHRLLELITSLVKQAPEFWIMVDRFAAGDFSGLED